MKSIRRTYYFLLLTVLIVITFARQSNAVVGLDQGFGHGGVSITDFDSRNDRAYAVVEQQDGKILVAGVTDNGSVTDMALARYTKDGKLDAGFGKDGRVVLDINGNNAVAYAIALQTDGKILLAGSTETGGKTDIALVRLTADGKSDPQFNETGWTTLPLGTGNSSASGIQVQDDGGILIACSAHFSDGAGAAVMRFKQDGSLDTGFGVGGNREIGQGNGFTANALKSQMDGKILLAGSIGSGDGHSQAVLYRLTAAGLIDSSFGQNGAATVGTDNSDSALFGLTVQPDGKILVAGYSENSNDKEILLARVSDSGLVDTTFGENGIVLSKNGTESVAYAIALLPDGSTLATGYGMDGDKKKIVLAQYDSNGNYIGNSTQDSNSRYASDQVVGINGSESSSQNMRSTASVLQTSVQTGIVTDGGADVADSTSLGAVPGLVSSQGSIGCALAVRKDGSVIAAGIADNGNNNDFSLLALDSSTSTSSSSDATTTSSYSISTTRITGIKRTSAISGGTITGLGSSNQAACESNCSVLCADSTDTTCLTTCDATCIPPTVTGRGVCYSIVPLPVYRSTSTDTSSNSSTSSSSSSSTSTSSSSSNGQQTQSSTLTSSFELVRSGQTEDGFGTGSYGSDISKVSPGTTYYVRAYAVLSDDTVVYGDQQSFTTNDACFIATAAYGSILERHVVTLRLFRDQYLKTNKLGRMFVAFYYRWSPRAAEIIASHQTLRKVVRVSLFPIVWLSSFMVYTSLQMKMVLALSGIGIFIGVFCFHPGRSCKVSDPKNKKR